MKTIINKVKKTAHVHIAENQEVWKKVTNSVLNDGFKCSECGWKIDKHE